MVLFHLLEVAIFLWQPEAVEGAKISTTLSIHQVVPQVTAAEAAGQVLSNSVEAVMVEGEDECRGGSKRSQGFGENLMEFSDVVEHMVIN